MKKKGVPIHIVVLLSVFSTVLVMAACTAPMLYRMFRQTLIHTAETAGRQAIAQTGGIVNNYLSGMDSAMQTVSAALAGDEEERASFFRAFFLIRPNVAAVTTYNAKGELLDCYSQDHPLAEPLETNLSMDVGRLRQSRIGYTSAPHVATFFEGWYPWVVTMVRPIETEGEERYVALDIGCVELSSYINDVGIGRRGYCFLMDTDGNIVYHPQQQLIYSDLKAENLALISGLEDGSHLDGNVIYTVQSLSGAHWRLIGVSYVQEAISAGAAEMRRIVLVLAALLIGAAFLISLILSRFLSAPIRGLEQAMREFEQDADRFVYEPAGGSREVRNLSDSFGHMVRRIQRLMKQVRDEEINLRKTELRALQAQINPHFLYNSLDSITWMCERGKTEEAVLMVNALARLFRISISRGHELIPIRSELQHAESYLQIQSVRYRGQFTYRFEAEEDCLDCLCTKIIIQPFLENAINHGINGLTDESEITVSVYGDGGDVVFLVEDNGVGMTEEQIEAILQKERSDRAGIGIKNVNDRLKIYFGSAYGITIESAPDEGTRVYLRIPKVREESEYEKR